MFIYIPTELLQVLCHFEGNFSKVIFGYFIGFIWSLLSMQGRKVVTNIKRNSFFIKKSISSWERFVGEYAWNHLELVQSMLKFLLKKYIGNFIIHGKLLMAVDTTLIAKNSDKMFGTQKWKNHSGNADAGQYISGHHWGLLGIIGKFLTTRYICFPLLMRIITGKKVNYQWISGENGIQRMTFWDIVHAMILEINEWLGYEIRVVVDAYFSNNSFIAPLMAKSITVITRLRENGVAHLDFEQPVVRKRGRPRKKGKQIKVFDIKNMVPAQKVEVLLYGKTQTVEVYVKDLLMLDLPQKVRTVLVKSSKGIIALISTDLTLGAKEIIEIYGSRFSIEICIREMKSNLGLENYQFQSFYAILRYVHLIMTANNVGKILLLDAINLKWLKTDEDTDKNWVSGLSFSWLKYGLRKYALEKIVLEGSAEYRDSLKKSGLKEALLNFAT
jgi:hypothetical protein